MSNENDKYAEEILKTIQYQITKTRNLDNTTQKYFPILRPFAIKRDKL
ncbi:MAG: hypothetical protein LBI79_07895 [Nitrososphaerota archaeon]|nr:hypothetical protein [Nitrososphaerota archaeon]